MGLVRRDRGRRSVGGVRDAQLRQGSAEPARTGGARGRTHPLPRRAHGRTVIAEPQLGQTACEQLADAAFDAVNEAAVDVEVVIHHNVEGLTRFANSQVHQNVARDDLAAAVRVVLDGGRSGVVNVHTDGPGVVARAARDAMALARMAPPDPEFPGLAPAAPTVAVPVDEATIAASPENRAGAVRDVLSEIPDEYEAAGAYRTVASELAVFTSAGQRIYAPGSVATLTMVVMGPTSSGYAEGGERAMADIDAAGTAASAVAKAAAGHDPVDVPAGSWPVVLEPPAVATMVQFLAYLGFGGRDYLEGRSFTAGHLGERCVDPRLTVVDDALSPLGTGLPFDYEGTPKQRVELIRDGAAVGIVHDRHSAAKAGTSSTGHGLPAPNTHGPLSMNPALLAGDGGAFDDVIGGCERGLLVTRFHYTNVVHPKETSITGMTRDGTFLVEDGRISAAVKNLRFTQSILAALEHVEAISSQTAYATEIFEEGGHFPSLRLPTFTFSGATSFG
ncbi:MAG: hypothetical protein GEU74_01215 [Nitriliruptorales bacterium]|nr:hypothetical protein [Nitriliruptorales bacterium]